MYEHLKNNAKQSTKLNWCRISEPSTIAPTHFLEPLFGLNNKTNVPASKRPFDSPNGETCCAPEKVTNKKPFSGHDWKILGLWCFSSSTGLVLLGNKFPAESKPGAPSYIQNTRIFTYP